MLQRHIMLRRLKKDVLGQIPALQRSRVSVLPDPVNLKVLPSAHSGKPHWNPMRHLHQWPLLVVPGHGANFAPHRRCHAQSSHASKVC